MKAIQEEAAIRKVEVEAMVRKAEAEARQAQAEAMTYMRLGPQPALN